MLKFMVYSSGFRYTRRLMETRRLDFVAVVVCGCGSRWAILGGLSTIGWCLQAFPI